MKHEKYKVEQKPGLSRNWYVHATANYIEKFSVTFSYKYLSYKSLLLNVNKAISSASLDCTILSWP